MKKFFENCGWGYVVVFAALILMVICGAAMMGVGMWGWLTAECDIAAVIGMFVGFSCVIYGLYKFNYVKEEARRLMSED